MTWLSERAVGNLRSVLDRPDLEGTRYELAEELGRGGMGRVYRVRDPELGRDVALKVLRDPAAPEELVRRLLAEARILARLEHPGIVPVHDVGRLADGRVFYAMKLVRGERLDRYARGGRTLPDLLRVFERACEAVAFAHGHGVVHRDLKPENVMIGPYGEVLVLDWGVAKVLGAEDSTDHGSVVGTPGYMAPEQAGGDPGRVDGRSDVYGLGAILFFLLTGRTPPSGTGWGGDPPSPRRIDRSVPRPLDAICRRALATEPDGRYASVEALADDVARWLTARPVAAHREGVVERAGRLATKYRTVLVLLVAYLLMRIAFLVLGGL